MKSLVAAAKKKRNMELYARVSESYKAWLKRNSSRPRTEKVVQFDAIFDAEFLKDEIDDFRASSYHN